MRDDWLMKQNTLIWWPNHIRKHIWWAGQSGIYGKLLIGPWLPRNHKNMLKTGLNRHSPYDLRCNCCFVCSWLLRITIRPILDIFDWIVKYYNKFL